METKNFGEKILMVLLFLQDKFGLVVYKLVCSIIILNTGSLNIPYKKIKVMKKGSEYLFKLVKCQKIAFLDL
jgi:hypothetical protein